MIKGREPILERISVAFQVILTLLTFYFVLWISDFFASDLIRGNNEHLIFALIIISIWFVLLELFEMGKMARIQRYRHIIKKYAFVVSIGSFILISLTDIFGFQYLTGAIILKFALLNFLNFVFNN